MEQNILNCLILGSGPAGLTAAIYASRAGLNPVVYEGIQPGGQLTTTTEIENFPGYPQGTTGVQMMDDLRQQALRFGADIRWGIATEVDFSEKPYKVTIDGTTTLLAHTVIIATGASAKYLGLEDEAKYAGSGVSACATCDGFFYRKKVVAVVGGGDTACEEAMYLASLCKHVYLIVRRDVLRASQVMQDRVKNKENITILYKHQTVGLTGDGVVEGANLVKSKGEEGEENVHIDIDGAELSKTVKDTHGLRGDIKLTLQKLLPMLNTVARPEWMAQVAAYRAEEEQSADNREGMTPRNVILTLNKHLGDNTPVATDVGQHQMWAIQHFHFDYPGQLLTSGGFGTMGFGLGAAIGATLLILGKTTEAVAKAIEQINYIIQFLMELVSNLVPYFIFIILVQMIWSDTLGIVVAAWKPVVIFMLAMLILSGLMLLLAAILCKVSPILILKKGFSTFIIGVSTASSIATFGNCSNVCEKKFGIANNITSFGVPLGIVMFPPATAIYFIFICLFT